MDTALSSVLRGRMRAHWLADRPGRTVAAVAAHVVGIPAQDTAAARLAVRARSTGLVADDVRRAARERTVVRTWLMRGTLHLVAATDVRWLLALFGPRNAAAGAGRRRQLGLTESLCARALSALPEILGGGVALGRAELVDRLARAGVPVDPKGQAPAHLVGYAAARGVLCRGPDLDRDEPGYVLLDEWVPPLPSLSPLPLPSPLPSQEAEAAVAELARRYLAAYGPAGPEDLAAWSGLPLGQCRRVVPAPAAGTAERGTAGAPAARGAAARGSAARGSVARGSVARGAVGVRLLGAFDPYLLGYRTREPALDPRFAARVQAGGGIIHPVVVVDGRVVGTWRLRRGALDVAPFADPVPDLAAEAADLARFLGVDVALS